MHFFLVFCFNIVLTVYIESDKKQNASNVVLQNVSASIRRIGEMPYQLRLKKLLDYRTTKCKTEYTEQKITAWLLKYSGNKNKGATALGLATHYYKSVDADLRQNEPCNEWHSEETR